MTDNKATNPLPSKAQKIVPIREAYAGPLLPFSYTLKLDATIIDRKSNQELTSVTGDDAMDLGRKLLAIHPGGGRLRLAENGYILGYEKDAWVVIGAVSSSEWFPIFK